MHCMPAPCPGGAKTSLFFTGCSNGIIKSWPIPTSATSSQTATSPSSSTQPSSYWGFRMNLRLKNSISVMKMHTAPITALISKPVDSPAGWLLASGDERGVVCLTRGNEKSSSTTCCSTTIHPGATKLGGVNSSNGAQATTPRAQPAREGAPVSKVLTGGQPSISCLAFIGTPSTFLEPGAGNKSKAGKKAGSGGAAVGVSGGTTGGASVGSEEYLGVGTSTGLISVLDLATAHPIYQVAGHAGRVTQIIGLRTNEFISCSMDRSIKLWDIRTRNRPTQTFGGKILEERSLGASNYRKCAASPITAIAVGGGDSSLVISTSADGVVRLWDRRYDVNVPCCVTQGHTNRITAIAWNGVNEFHTASHDGTVRTWDSINGQNTFMLQAFNEEGITNMKMTSFKCAQHIMITPRGPVTFTDPDKLGNRTCIVTSGWNGTIKSFVHDV